MMRTANPALNAKVFDRIVAFEGGNTMTLSGTVNKCFILVSVAILSAAWAWHLTEMNPSKTGGLMALGGIGGFIFALITVFKNAWAPVTAPIYAILEGLFLGAISYMYNLKFDGIVFNAVVLTFGIFFCLLFAYKSRLIKPTENFKLGIAAATGGIMVLYMISMMMNMFGSGGITMIHDSGMMGIGFSCVVVVIAALNLVLDFDYIEEASAKQLPKYMEWYAAFGLLVTLIWLYLEILRLLAKMNSRD